MTSLICWLIFTGLAVVCIVLLTTLTPPYSSVFFVVLMGGVMAAAWRLGGLSQRRALQGEIAALRWDYNALRTLVFKSRHELTARVSAATAVALMVGSAHVFRPGNTNQTGIAAAIGLVGVLALGVALKLTRRAEGSHVLPVQLSASPIRRRLVFGGILALGLLAAINTSSAFDESRLSRLLSSISPQAQFLLFVGGVGALVWGTGGFSPSETPRTPAVQRWGERAAVLAILLLALTVRLWQLEYGIHRFVDEHHYANAVTRLWDAEDIKLLLPFSEVTSFTWVFPFLQSLTVGLFGPSLSSLRLPGVFFGTLTVLAVYLLAKTLFDRKTALLAALFLAAFPPHLQFSRLALNNIADPFFGTLALTFLAQGFKTGQRRDFVLAGACLGLTQYFYEGGRLLFPLLTGVWLVWITLNRDTAANTVPRIHIWRRIGVFVVVALLVAAPLYYTLVMGARPVTPRLNDTRDQSEVWADGSLTAALNRLKEPFLLYVHRPDPSWFYGGTHALIMGYMLPLFLLGVAQAIWRLRHPGMALLMLWLAAVPVGNSLLREVESPRYVVAFPAVALALAVGARYTLPLIWQHPARTQRAVCLQVAAVGAAAMMLAGAQIHYYFSAHLDGFQRQFILFKDADDAMFRAVKLPPNTDVHLVTRMIIWDFNMYTALRFWNRHVDLTMDALSPERITRDYLDRLLPQRNQAFFVEPEDVETAALLREYFPLVGAPQISPWAVPVDQQFVLYYVPKEMIVRR